jgi:tetratricopeptide (TPR) repeat protein
MKLSIERRLEQAYVHMAEQDFGSAARQFAAAHKAQPGNAAVIMGTAILYNQIGQPDKALPLLQDLWKTIQSQKKKPSPMTQSEVMAQVGRSFELLGRLPQALGAWQLAQQLHLSTTLAQRIEALQRSPAAQTHDPLAAVLARARQQAATAQWPQASASYQAALLLHADSDEALNGLADVLRHTGHLEQALTLIQRAIVLQPEVAAHHSTLALVYLGQNENDKALKALRRSIKLDPSNAHALCNQGVALRRLGRLPDAVRAYQAAINVAPNMAEAWNNLGNVYREMQNKDQALTHYRKALSLKPSYADAQRNLDELELAKKPARKAAPVKAAPIKASPVKAAPKPLPKKAAQVKVKASAKTPAKAPSKAAKKTAAKMPTKTSSRGKTHA